MQRRREKTVKSQTHNVRFTATMHNLTQATETSYGPRASTGNCAMKSLTQFGEDPNT